MDSALRAVGLGFRVQDLGQWVWGFRVSFVCLAFFEEFSAQGSEP